jgi:bifunctional non-homologous end joining protein LigD
MDDSSSPAVGSRIAECAGPRTTRPGSKSSSSPCIFVVQRHDAARLHYDFRLELDGVLKSWAVPKGPSLDPAVKRLAIQVEDHPLGYGRFEGRIAPGQYGAGEVLLWDTGIYLPLGAMPADEQLRRGELKFILKGHKLTGGFVLVRLRSAAAKREWLLIKRRDAETRTRWNIEDHGRSVKTGKSS